ncbi:MAG: signal peptide peptidase SppA [Bacteroidales bacterium]|jgi:protease-4|nr:signal peptide peptidase SppA [Bacteroidales bacterium]
MKNFFKNVLATVVGLLLFFMVMWVIMLAMIVAIAGSTDTAPTVKNNSILKLDLSVVNERVADSPFDIYMSKLFGQTDAVGLNNLKKVIAAAKEDPKIKGIELNVSKLAVSPATCDAIRNLLEDFAEEKPIFCYGDYFTTSGYYLASVSDHIYMHPDGSLMLAGLSMKLTFFKKMLDKLGIEMQIIRHGTFKSAVEPFMLDKMSPANELQYKTLLNSIWGHICQKISESRDISVDYLNKICDLLMVVDDANFAVEANLIDDVLYKDQYESTVKDYLEIPQSDDIQYITYNHYKKSILNSTFGSKGDEIAIVYAVGDIMEASDNSYSQEEVVAYNIVEELSKVRMDENVKAVVFRVNSPGGSALLSESIWREVSLTQKVKPVVVSMGDYAASGGYYIACAADYIVTEPTTLTGSIGVFGMFPYYEKALEDKLGITFDVVNTNEHSEAFKGGRKLDAFERQFFQKSVDRTYALFTERVAEGRHLSVTLVDSLGQGRVWSGISAVKLGLADTLGGIDVAIAKAAALSHIEKYTITEYPKIKPFWAIFMDSETETALQQKILGKEAYTYLYNMQSVLQMKGIQARLPYLIEFQ